MISRWSLVVFAGCWLTANVSGQSPQAPRMDALGDPLPPGAVARLGTLRLKHAPGQRRNILAAVFSQDGKMVATRDDNGLSVRLWNVATGKEIRGPWSSPNRNASTVAISPDGTTVAIATFQITAPRAAYITLYDIQGQREIKAFGGLRNAPTALAFERNGKTLVTAGFGTVAWWDIGRGKEIRSWQPFGNEQVPQQDGSVRAKTFDVCALSPDAKFIAVNVATSFGGVLPPPPPPGQNTLVDHEAIGFDLASRAMTWRTEGKYPVGQPTYFAFSADGKRVAIALGPDSIEVRNATNGKLVAAPAGRQFTGINTITSLALSADGKTAALRGIGSNTGARISYYSEDMGIAGDVVLWDVDNGKTSRKVSARNESNSTACVQFSPDNKTLAVGVRSHLQLYDAASLREIHAWPGHRSPVEFLTFSKDGSRLSTGSAVNDLQPRDLATWDTGTWKPVGHASLTRSPRPNVGNVSPDQSLYVGSTGNDRFALYDFKSGKLVARFHVPPARAAQPMNMVYYLPQPSQGSGFFSPSGRSYVLHRQDERGRAAEGLYAVPSGKLLCLLPPLAMVFSRMYPDTGSIRPIAFSPDDRLVALFSQDDGKIHIIETATGKARPPLGPGWGIEGDDPVSERQRIQQLYAFAGSLAFSPDGKSLASWNTLDNLIHVWDIAASREVQRFPLGEPRERVVIDSGIVLGSRAYFAWAPDGRTLAVAANTHVLTNRDVLTKIQLWELATGRVRMEWPGHDGVGIRALAYAPGGKFLASGSTDTTVLIWDLSLVEQAITVANGEAATVATHWQTLGDDDAARAFAAIRALTATQDESVAWIKEHLLPALPVDTGHIEALISQLDESGFRARQKATAELIQIGERAVLAIDKTLAGSPTLETRRRLEEVRKRVSSRMLTGKSLQAYRAVEVLERIGTPAAREVLQLLAGGAPGAMVTTQAEEALARLRE
jgi:WD40 repeat protein